MEKQCIVVKVIQKSYRFHIFSRKLSNQQCSLIDLTLSENVTIYNSTVKLVKESC